MRYFMHMETYNNMEGLASSAANDIATDRKFLAKNALQIKLASAFLGPMKDDDYDSFIAFGEKYGEALQHIIAENEDVALEVLDDIVKTPDADLNPAQIQKIKDLLALPTYSKYIH